MMKPRDGMSEGEHLSYRWFRELFTRGDLAVADEILAKDVRYHGPQSLTPSDVSEPDDIKEYVSVYQQAFPDLAYTIKHAFETGDQVCVRWTVSGTQESELFEMEYHGEEFTADGVNIFTIDDGQITAVSSQWDTLKMVQELGIIPPISGFGQEETDENTATENQATDE
jgi:steroid delta-isomerase-like uncharacterized protein